MRILFISRWFAPRDIIGAVRPTQLCKYLAQARNEIICVTETNDNREYSDELLHPLVVKRVSAGRVGTYSMSHSNRSITARKSTTPATSKNRNRTNLVLKHIRLLAYQIIHILDEIEWARKANRQIENDINAFKPEVIITSYGPESSVLAGLKFKKRHPEVVWVSDMRDPMTHSQQSWWRKRINSHWEKRMARRADAITTISDSLGEKYKRAYKHKKVGVFVNGYDPEDKCIDLSKNDGVLRIGYTGALYGGRRKMEALFKAIKDIEKSYGGHVPLEVHYAGGDVAELYQQAEPFDATDYIVDHGLLPRLDAQKLQEECDILCVLSWNTTEEKGVLTGKFPEYLRLKKTVLALVSGEIPEAELTKRINDMRCGYSYEYCSGDRGYSDFKNWLKDVVDLKASGEALASEMDISLVEQYSYDSISLNYEQFLRHLQ